LRPVKNRGGMEFFLLRFSTELYHESELTMQHAIQYPIINHCLFVVMQHTDLLTC